MYLSRVSALLPAWRSSTNATISSGATSQRMRTVKNVAKSVRMRLSDGPILDLKRSFTNVATALRTAPPPSSARTVSAILEIIAHLGAALIQADPTDDPIIIIGYVGSADELTIELRRRAAQEVALKDVDHATF